MKNRILLFAILLLPSQGIFPQVMNVYTEGGQIQQFDISEIDSITFNSTAGTLKWLGHASIKLRTNDGYVIYVDPYAGSDYSEPADLILVTHGHSDHNKVNLVTQGENCKIYSGPSASVGGTTLSAGDSALVDGVKIHAVEAYNDHHPKGTGVGFVIEINGLRIYHSGDTSKTAEMAAMASLALDYALLCIDGVYNMGPDEAKEVAELIKAKKVIPIHVAPSGASEQQKQQNVDKFDPPNRLIMKEGDTIFL